MANIQEALERIIYDLNSWCETWTPNSYTDPRISLTMIANRAKSALENTEEIDSSLIIKDGDCLYYRGNKYKKVEPPRMELLFKASTHIVDYNKQTYYRIEKKDFPPAVWYKRSLTDTESHKLVYIADKETERLLEMMYLSDVFVQNGGLDDD